MRRFKIISIVSVVLLFSVSELIFSQPFGRGMGRGMGFQNPLCPYPGYYANNYNNVLLYPRCLNFLNLTQDQISKINEINTKFMDENISQLNELQKKNVELQNFMTNKNIDRNSINAKIDEVSKIRTELQKKVITKSEDVKNVLSEQQKELIGSNNFGFGMCGLTYKMGARFGRGFGAGAGYLGNYGKGLSGGIGFGRGPCGLGLGRGLCLW